MKRKKIEAFKFFEGRDDFNLSLLSQDYHNSCLYISLLINIFNSMTLISSLSFMLVFCE